MIYVLGIFVVFSLSFISLTKTGRTLPDSILGIWLTIIGLHLLVYYFW